MKSDVITKIREQIQTSNKKQLWILDNCIYLSRAGSWLYGLNHEKSDEDFIGVTVPPIQYWGIGLENFEQWEWKTEQITIHSLKKFLKLAGESSPNLTEHLFNTKDSPNTLIWEPLWQKVIDNRDKLLSSKIYHTFSGYSASQKHKIVCKQSNKNGREALRDEFGFDVKYAMHAVRLMRQGIELLRDGKMEFPRKDAKELLDIRFGKRWTLDTIDEFFAYWDQLDIDIKKAYESSVLQWGCDREWLNGFILDIFKEHIWNGTDAKPNLQNSLQNAGSDLVHSS